MLESVSQTGGHLSSNLGTVELTIALHYVFNTPNDRMVWDVGHQTYPHKILTGRRDAMPTLRQFGGISGFPRRSESEYDTFGTAHSSTSISAALGMAVAARNSGRDAPRRRGDRRRCDERRHGVRGAEQRRRDRRTSDLLVILNDNDMSISPAVGALNRYLARLMSGKFYAAAKTCRQAGAAGRVPPVFELAQQVRRAREGHGGAGHDVRGIRLQLHRADRWPRSRLADADAAEPARRSVGRSSCTW